MRTDGRRSTAQTSTQKNKKYQTGPDTSSGPFCLCTETLYSSLYRSMIESGQKIVRGVTPNDSNRGAHEKSAFPADADPPQPERLSPDFPFGAGPCRLGRGVR